MPNIQQVDFHGHALQSWQDDTTQKIYVAMRRLCEEMGMNWSGQRTKLAKSLLFKEAVRCVDIHTPGGLQEVVGLDLDLLPAWLLSISAEKVAPDIRSTLILFQQECAQALRDYWFHGVAVNPRLAEPPALAKYPELRAIMDLIVATAEARDLAETAQREAEAAKGLAQLALHGQEWLTVRQYVLVHHLEHQLPESLQPAYGTWLKDHCRERNIPVYEARPADRRWDTENTYHSGTIHATLLPWLTRRSGQGALLTLPVRQAHP